MIWIVFAILLFAFLLLLPIGVSLFWYRRNGDKSVLCVRQNRTRDPRYFSNAYTKLFREAWEKRDQGAMVLHKDQEPYLLIDGLNDPPKVCDRLVVAESTDFSSRSGSRFEKEIYCLKSARITDHNQLRAIHADGDLELGSGLTLMRWADADGAVTTGNNCDFGISLTSATSIELGANCKFHRIYAPEIHVGKPGPVNPPLYTLASDLKNIHKRHVSPSRTDGNGMTRGNYIARGRIRVDENLVVNGSIRSHRGVIIGAGALICGNIFADGDIYISENATVLGNVFSQGDIYCEKNVTIGSSGEIRSVIARQTILLEERCTVYGYLSSEDGGMCWPDETKLENTRKSGSVDKILKEARIPLPGKRRVRGLVAALAGLICLALVCIGANLLLTYARDAIADAPIVMEADMYRNQGLAPGVNLAIEPDSIGEDKIVFKDRELILSSWTDSDARERLQVYNDLFRKNHQLYPEVGCYLICAPLRVAFEEPFTPDPRVLRIVDSEKQVLADLEQLAAEDIRNASAVPVIEVLADHQEEFLFYRGINTWTQRGSYYASQEFLEAAGLPTFPMSEFSEMAKHKAPAPGNDITDRHYVYLYDDYNPLVMNIRTQATSPMYTAVRNGYGAFMPVGFGTSELPGLAENGRVLMLLGGHNARLLAPWMVNSFETILSVDTDFYLPGSDRFWSLYELYGVTDLLVVNDPESIADVYMNQKLNDLIQGQ